MKPEQLIASMPDLPVPSNSAIKLAQLLTSLDASGEEVVEIVKRDGVLCAKVLAFCNSAFFSFSGRVGSVDHAILLLGYREMQHLVLALGFGGPLRRALPGYAIEGQELWRHSLITAQAADWVVAGARTPVAEPSVAYTAGLVHDIGKLVLNHALDDAVQTEMRRLVESEGKSRLEAEQAVLETDHAEVGACLLQRWRLPDTIVEAVAHHHRPVSKPIPRLSAVVHLANLTAHEVGSAPGWDSYAVRADEDTAADLGFDAEALERILLKAYEALPRIDEMLNFT